MEKQARIFVAGHRGMVGSALVRALKCAGYEDIITAGREQLDLTRQSEVEHFFNSEKPDYVFLAAARVGGIIANSTCKGEFIHDNLMIQGNIIHSSWQNNVKRLLFLGSTCIYPKFAPQPMKEEHLLSGLLEPTNDAYAIAKIAGIYQCRSYNQQYGTRYMSAMPNNLYGPYDNYDLEKSHVLPAMLRKFHEAKQRGDASVTIWGSGTPLREFLHVDDLAEACLYIMNLGDKPFDELLNDVQAPALLNVGSGEEIRISDLALLVKKIVGFEGSLVFDREKPDGTPRKLADSSRINRMGWHHNINLEDGVAASYQWYLENYPEARL